MAWTKPAVALDEIARVIHTIRGHRVMLDADLARLYGVTTKVLKQAVRRNLSRFPEDFMFELAADEAAALRSQIVSLSETPDLSSQSATSSEPSILRSQIVTSSLWGGHRYLPWVFTEQGVAMLSSVLRSERAVQVNIEIMRAFVRLRQWALSVEDLTTRLDALEGRYDRQFKVVFDAIRELMTPPASPPKRIGFRAMKE